MQHAATRPTGRLFGLAFALAFAAQGHAVWAQTARPEPQPAPALPMPPSPSEEGFEGRVAAYLLGPDANVAGLVFDDGRDLRVPPRWGERLALLVHPGDAVRVGAAASAEPGAPRAIVAVASGRALADGAPDGAAAAGDPAGTVLKPIEASGRIRQTLRAPRGEVGGVLLDTGVQVFFPPHVAAEAAAWLVPGRSIDVSGYGRTSVYGTAVQATRLSSGGAAPLEVYARPPRPR